MPANELHFSSNFKDILDFCKVKKLFLGSGNPIFDILIVGKEVAIDMVKNKKHNRTYRLIPN